MNELIRDLHPEDHARVVALNDAVVEWTSPLSEAQLDRLVMLMLYRKALIANDRFAGFLLAAAASSSYDNDNLSWFQERYSSFLYVDRVVIAPELAGSGFGRKFYEHLFDYARQAGFSSVVCEYTSEPVNEASRAFHAHMGFAEVGRRRLRNSDKEVSMQLKIL